MDTAARIDAAKARLDVGRAIIIRAKEAGPPCTECAYYIPEKPRPYPNALPVGPFCGHLAYTDHAFSPVNGEVSQTVQVKPAKARADDGLCGFEAVLFEPNEGRAVKVLRGVPKVAMWAFLYLWSSAIVWALIIGGLNALTR